MSDTSTAPDDVAAGVAAGAVVATDGPEDGPLQLTAADRVARRVLRIEDEVPGALFPMRGSLVLSAVRCLITYVAIPLLVPIAGWLAPIAAPISLLAGVVALGMAVVSLRRVWAAHWEGRWAYTAFAVAVIVALVALIAFDVSALLG